MGQNIRGPKFPQHIPSSMNEKIQDMKKIYRYESLFISTLQSNLGPSWDNTYKDNHRGTQNKHVN